MNKLIAIVGVSGVGKTTLVHALAQRGNFELALEEHNERPFQSLFKQDPKYTLANQLDYLLFRAEQERTLRKGDKPALMDGGFDLDFHGFTRLFHAHGWLTDSEFDLCRRFYNLTRDLLPLPELIIALNASPQTITQRLASRERINIATSNDEELLSNFINEWLDSLPKEKVMKLDTTSEEEDYPQSIERILERIKSL